MTLVTRSGRQVTVTKKLAAGGQGEVFATIDPDMVFKRFLPAAQQRDATLATRLAAMVANRSCFALFVILFDDRLRHADGRGA